MLVSRPALRMQVAARGPGVRMKPPLRTRPRTPRCAVSNALNCEVADRGRHVQCYRIYLRTAAVHPRAVCVARGSTVFLVPPKARTCFDLALEAGFLEAPPLWGAMAWEGFAVSTRMRLACAIDGLVPSFFNRATGM